MASKAPQTNLVNLFLYHRMERLSEGAREPTSFFQWQKEMREKDLQKEVIKIRRRLVESGINEAAVARTRIMESNQINAQLKKEEVGDDHSTIVYSKVSKEMGSWTKVFRHVPLYSYAYKMCY